MSLPTSPSFEAISEGRVPSGKQLGQSIVAVLEGTTWGAGDKIVTKYPNYPAEPPSPWYIQRITMQQAPADPCTLKWAGYETNCIIDTDDDLLTPNWHWCQPND